MPTIDIEQSWKLAMENEFEKQYFKSIVSFLKNEKKLQKVIFPPGGLIFNAFNSTPFNNVRVLILGQDPYHGLGQAHGLCFSVQDGVKVPPSLVNIYKELFSDLKIPISQKGNLAKWAQQGVLLLNASLTVQEAMPMSHSKIGWGEFTDAVIKKVSDEHKHVVFLLWGKFAQQKETLIDNSKHLILKAAHPSPLSAHNGFLGCKHFSKTNEYLVQDGQKAINWNVEDV